MYDEMIKKEYCAAQPSKELRGRVKTACTAAKRKRNTLWRSMSAAAACLVVVLCLAVFGGSAPMLYSSDTAIGRAPMAVEFQTIATGSAAQGDLAVARMGGMPMENCIPLSINERAQIRVSAGELYLFDEVSATASPAGQSLTASRDERLYWCVAGLDESADAELSLSAGVHTRSWVLSYDSAAAEWTLCEEN